ncbi:MAG: Hint domain-containing protein [Pseudomonadota bacterium]
MPNGGTITGYLFADFSFSDDGGELTPDQNGPIDFPTGSSPTAEIANGAQTIDINVLDDDDEFDDGFQDDPNGEALNQTLRDPINTTDAQGNPVTVPAGAVLEVEFTLTVVPEGGGASIDLLFVAAGPGENKGDIIMVVSTAPLQPGVVYNIVGDQDGGGTPYGEIVCFARSTRILTPTGYVPVETLTIGDLVETVDHGAQPIVWSANRAVLFPSVQDAPIVVRAGAFGPGRPFADLWVSPQHGLVWNGACNSMLFDTATVLSSAKNFVNGTTIWQARDSKVIEYFHFMLNRHQIVLANGMETESFYPGRMARRALSPAAHAALVALHPTLADPEAPSPFAHARLRVKGHELQVARAAHHPAKRQDVA